MELPILELNLLRFYVFESRTIIAKVTAILKVYRFTQKDCVASLKNVSKKSFFRINHDCVVNCLNVRCLRITAVKKNRTVSFLSWIFP